MSLNSSAAILIILCVAGWVLAAWFWLASPAKSPPKGAGPGKGTSGGKTPENVQEKEQDLVVRHQTDPAIWLGEAMLQVHLEGPNGRSVRDFVVIVFGESSLKARYSEYDDKHQPLRITAGSKRIVVVPEDEGSAVEVFDLEFRSQERVEITKKLSAGRTLSVRVVDSEAKGVERILVSVRQQLPASAGFQAVASPSVDFGGESTVIDGQWIASMQYQVSPGDVVMRIRTDRDGLAKFPGLRQGEVEVAVEYRAAGARREIRRQVPSSQAEITIVLQ